MATKFKPTLAPFSRRLRKKDVKHMAFLVQAVEELKPECFRSGTKLFKKLEESGRISHEKPGFLRTLLENIRRVDLAEEITGQSVTLDPDVNKAFQDRVQIHNILRKLDDKNMDDLIYIYDETNDNVKDEIDLGLLLVRSGGLNNEFTSNLENIGRLDLAEMMKTYLGGHLTNPEEVPGVSKDGGLFGCFQKTGHDSDDIPEFGEEFEVKVQRTKKQFVKDNEKGSYPMKSIPRGLVLIINVKKVVNFAPREGTDVDRDKLKSLFKQLHFDVIVHNDCDGLTANEIKEKIKKFSEREDHAHSDASIICLLSHGKEGHIFGTDGGPVKLSDIYSMFNSGNCPNLLGKPKIFIHQACRDPLTENDGPGGNTPTNADMLFCFPTESEQASFRNTRYGSWYIQNIVIIFMRYAKEMEINSMMSLVNGRVAGMETVDMQMPENLNRLTKLLYFFP